MTVRGARYRVVTPTFASARVQPGRSRRVLVTLIRASRAGRMSWLIRRRVRDRSGYRHRDGGGRTEGGSTRGRLSGTGCCRRRSGRTACGRHPGGVLLPAAYITAELAGGQWRPIGPGTEATPQGARDSLAFYLRVFGPWQLGLDLVQRAVYAAATDELDAGRGWELEVAGGGSGWSGSSGWCGSGRTGLKGRGSRTTILSRRSTYRSSSGMSKTPPATITRTRRSSLMRTPKGWPGLSARRSNGAGRACRTRTALIRLRTCDPGTEAAARQMRELPTT